METLINTDRLLLFLGVFLGISLAVIAAIMLDLWDGVHTARVTGTKIHSHKLRVTIDKVSEYWRFVLIGFLVDCLGMLFSFYALPFTALVFGAGLIAVEVKSMFEHAARRRSHTAQLPDLISRIVRCVHEKDARKLVEELTHNVGSRPAATVNKKTEL